MSRFIEKFKEGYQAAAQDDAELSSAVRVLMFLGLIAAVGIICVVAL